MREKTLGDDPQHRPIHYADMNLVADVDSQTDPTVDWLLQDVQGKAIRKGEHELQMGNTPNENLGSDPASFPRSEMALRLPDFVSSH
jgi:hypothetical protein